MKHREIQNLLIDIQTQFRQTREIMEFLLEQLKVGRCPAPEDIEKLGRELKELRERFDSLRTQAQQASGRILGDEITAEECAQLYEEGLAIQQERDIQLRRADLERFLRATSVDPRCAEALTPLQAQAVQALTAPEGPTADQAKPAQLFLQAMALGEEDNAGLDDLLEQMEAAIPDMPLALQRGLLRGKYSLREEERPAAQSAAEPHESVGSPSRPAEESPTDEKPSANGLQEASLDSESGEELRPLTRLKNNQPSASGFKKDLCRLPKLTCFLLPILSNLGILTARQMFSLTQIMECDPIPENPAKLEEILGQLVKKDLLAVYPVEEESVYCLTPYCVGSMQKSSVRQIADKIFRISIGTWPLVAAPVLSKKKVFALVAQNDLLITYMGRVKEQEPAMYEAVQASIRFQEGRYTVILTTRESVCPVQLCAPAELAELTGDLLFLAEEDVLPSPGQNLYRYTDRPWHRGKEGWEDVSVYPTTPIEEAPENDVPGEKVESAPKMFGTDTQAEPKTKVLNTVEGTPLEGVAVALEVPTQIEEVEDERTETASAERLSPNELDDKAVSVGPVAMAQALLDRCQGAVCPTDKELQELVFALLNSGIRKREGDIVLDELIQAVVLAQCVAGVEEYPGCRQLYEQLLAATDLHLGRSDYSGEKLLSLFPDDDDPKTEELMLSAYLRAMFAPGRAHDFILQSRVDNLFQRYEQYFPSFPEVKALFHILLNIRDSFPDGFTGAVLSYLGGQDKRAARLQELSQQAERLLKFNRNSMPHINGMMEMIDLTFGPKGDIQTCLQSVIQNELEERPLVKELLQDFQSTDHPGEVDDHKVEEFMDNTWSEARRQHALDLGQAQNRMELENRARRQIKDSILQRLDLLQEWLDMTEESVEKSSRSLMRTRDELRQTIPKVIYSLKCQPRSGGSVIQAMLEHLLLRLSNESEESYPFADLLRTGRFSLDEQRLPVVDSTLNEVRYFEPWRNMLSHIVTPVRGLREVREDIYDPDSPLFDNLAQANHISLFLGEEPENVPVKEAQEAAQEKYEDFREKLELDYTYNRLTESENETLGSLMRDYKEGFFILKDFGIWRAFLAALGRQVDEFSEQHSRRLSASLASSRSRLPEGVECPLLDKAEELLKKKNLALTEEYLNRFDAGERDLPEEIWVAQSRSNYFLNFLSPQVFDPIYKLCQNYTGKSLRNFGMEYLSVHRPADWGNRQMDGAKHFLSTWPAGKGAASPRLIGDLFRELGIKVEQEKAVSGKGQAECFELKVRHDRFNKADYRHPIAAFGTKLASPLRVACFFGTITSKQLVDSACALGLSGISVVLVDSAIDRAARYKIAEIVHTEKNTGQAPFLIIDRALMLYLAALQETERLPAMLQCALPYTIYQPFTRGSGATTDEMFCGRVSELSSITDDNGACIVYGGRQLGKTALLQRAANLGNVPEDKRYALFITISDCRDEATFVDKVVRAILNLDIPLPKAQTMTQLGEGLQALFREKRVTRLHLLLDEADSFLEAIAPQEYRPLQPLVDLRRETQNNFKFVLAGLHNVFRAKAASAPNSILGQLGDPLCVKPLSPMDALRLLSRPLEYLGFQIESDQNMSTILANTNNYPGIIQFFGFKLVESLSTQYAQYYNAAGRNPPFPLSDKQLRSIITSNEINDGIQRRIRLTLELDPRYFMLARCIAMLYLLHEGDMGGKGYGFSIQEIRDIAETWQIHCLEGADLRDYAALLDELVEMGILTRFKDRMTYRLRQYTFLEVIAPNRSMDALERHIMEENQKEGKEA